MKKVKLKLPSLKSTSKGIAEDLKAIREALNVKAPKEETRSKASSASPSKAPKKSITEVKVEHTTADASGRPVRQRKPNQRYTDLVSELEKPSRKRTISAISTASSVDYVESPKKKQPKKIAVSPSKKKKLTPKTATKKRAVSKMTAARADTEDSEEGEISSPKPKHRRPVSLAKKQVSEDEDDDIDEEEQFVPPPHIHDDDDDEDEEDYGYNNSGSADPDKPKRKYIRSGKYSKKSQSKKDQTSSQPTTTSSRVATFEAPPEFDDDEDGKQRQNMDSSPMFGSGLTSSMTMSHQTACDYMYDDRRQISTSQQHYMNDNTQYGTMSPSQMMGTGMMQQGVSLADYSSQSQMNQNTNQNYSQNQYDDTYEEGPALVYGPGPRTITYNGDYYFLSPIPPKRRISQGPRPRSSRYKPFSATYKPPDVYKYRERLKLLRKKQQRSQMPKRRSFDFYGSGGMGDEDYQFPSQRVYRRQMDETDHALEALKSTIGGNDEDDVGLMAAGTNMYGSSSATDDYFGSGGSTSALGMIGGGSSAAPSDWDNAAASRTPFESETRARSRGRGGRRPGTLLGGRKRRTTDEFSSRGVYADDSATDDNYRFTFGSSHTTKKRSSMATASKFDGNLSDEMLGSTPNELTGDHCYIKRPVGVGFSEAEDLGGVTISVQTRVTPAATLMDVQPDSYVFAQNSSFPFDNQEIF